MNKKSSFNKFIKVECTMNITHNCIEKPTSLIFEDNTHDE